jgi:hypothetical protein
MGSTSPQKARVAARLCRFGPPLAVLFIAYYSLEFQPWMASTLPLFWLTLFLARHPSKLSPHLQRFAVRAFMRKSLSLLLLLSLIGWVFDRSAMNLVWLAAQAQLFAGFTHFIKYEYSVDALKQAALVDESLFTALWNDNSIQVVSTDGKRYSTDQVEDVDPKQYPDLMVHRSQEAGKHHGR